LIQKLPIKEQNHPPKVQKLANQLLKPPHQLRVRHHLHRLEKHLLLPQQLEKYLQRLLQARHPLPHHLLERHLLPLLQLERFHQKPQLQQALLLSHQLVKQHHHLKLLLRNDDVCRNLLTKKKKKKKKGLIVPCCTLR
jgi:hypothetical protein